MRDAESGKLTDRERRMRKKNEKRKQQKKKQKKDKKGRKKNKKNKGKKRKQNTSHRKNTERQSCRMTGECIDMAVSMMKLRKDKVTNYLVQSKRIAAKAKTASRKLGKSSVFQSALHTLISSGGGNASAMTCGSSTTNTGAQQMTDLVMVLQSCQDDITAVCDPSALPEVNMDEMTVCKDAMARFDIYTTKCSNSKPPLTGAAACACWEDDSIAADVATIRGCDISKNNTAMVKAVANCKAAFGKCRKTEDAVSSAIHACNQGQTTLESGIKTVSDNKEAVTSLLTQVQKLTGSSSRSVWPQPRLGRSTTCADFTSSVDSVITMVGESLTSCSIKTTANSASSASITCTETEITTLKEKETPLSGAIESLDEELTVRTDTLTGECLLS